MARTRTSTASRNCTSLRPPTSVIASMRQTTASGPSQRMSRGSAAGGPTPTWSRAAIGDDVFLDDDSEPGGDVEEVRLVIENNLLGRRRGGGPHVVEGVEPHLGKAVVRQLSS